MIIVALYLSVCSSHCSTGLQVREVGGRYPRAHRQYQLFDNSDEALLDVQDKAQSIRTRLLDSYQSFWRISSDLQTVFSFLFLPVYTSNRPCLPQSRYGFGTAVMIVDRGSKESTSTGLVIASSSTTTACHIVFAHFTMNHSAERKAPPPSPGCAGKGTLESADC